MKVLIRRFSLFLGVMVYITALGFDDVGPDWVQKNNGLQSVRDKLAVITGMEIKAPITMLMTRSGWASGVPLLVRTYLALVALHRPNDRLEKGVTPTPVK